METVKDFNSEDLDRLSAAIEKAEKFTSGEIRLHVENTLEGDLAKRAAKVFDELGMDQTKDKTGVLFYIAIKSRHFAILGDKGINDKVGDQFWTDIRDHIITNIKDNKLVKGFEEGIIMAGKALAVNFPIQDDDENELDNEISIKDN